MPQRWVGRPLPRFEDIRLVQGAGQYTDDFSQPGQVYAAFVRAPHAHARIVSIDASRATPVAGVLAVLTGAEFVADGGRGTRHMPVPADTHDISVPAFGPYNGRTPLEQPHLPLAVDAVRYAGEAVALVVADSPAAARDAAEQVDIEYEPLPAVTDVRAALEPGAPLVWDGAPDNVAVEADNGDRFSVEQALAAAPRLVEHTFYIQRVANAQLEPRSVLASFDPSTGTYHVTSGSQGVARMRAALAAALGVPIERLHLVCPADVGGGFGSRSNVYAEQVAITWAARRLGRPVRWTSTRTEAFLVDYQGRDCRAHARLGLDASGRILALSVDLAFNSGGQTVSYVPLSNAMRILTSVYDVPRAYVRARGVLTHSVPIGPYRGAGRPEALYVMERLLDLAASRFAMDRLELRRRNLVAREQLPYQSPMGLIYDSGDFAGNMQRALELADWKGFADRRTQALARGRVAGIGFANYIEAPVGAPHEAVRIEVLPEGSVRLIAGTQSTGQGHETTFAQVLADELSLTPDVIRLVTGDTDVVHSGGGTHSDRSMRLAGALIVQAAAELREQCRELAAELLGAEPSSLVFDEGCVQTADGGQRISLFELARAARLEASAAMTGRIPAHPTGAAVAEVEIDPETGALELTRYTCVDDVGQPINPLVLHGQVHGGIVQALGQALSEKVTWGQAGEVLTGSFLDYALQRAAGLPWFTSELREDPTTSAANPLRVKGGGESGTTPCMAAVVNAAVDALAPLGIEDLQMPLSPAGVWSAIAGTM